MEQKIDKNLITLKEAAEISGYSSDYIGQLIRSGKIFGKQVYTNIAWMTTIEEVEGYKNKSKNSGSNGKNERKGLKTYFSRKKRKLALEINIIKLALGSLKGAWTLLLVTVLMFVALISFSIYFFTTDNIIQNNQVEQPSTSTSTLQF